MNTKKSHMDPIQTQVPAPKQGDSDHKFLRDTTKSEQEAYCKLFFC